MTKNGSSCMFVRVVFLKAFTRSAGLWDGLVDAGVEAAADGNVAGGVAGLSSLVPQFLFSSPFGSSVWEPHLRARRRSVTKAVSTTFLTNHDKDRSAHLYSRFWKVDFRCQSFSRKNVGIVGSFKLCNPREQNVIIIWPTTQMRRELFESRARRLPFSKASICSWVNDVLFLCSFLFSCRRIWVSSESSPLELMEFVFSPPLSCCWQPSADKPSRLKIWVFKANNSLIQNTLAILKRCLHQT